MTNIRLTQTIQKGGCAAKVPALLLREILQGVNFPPRPPELKVDGEYFDDAAIYQLNAEQSLVQTLDFFTPIVDSPDLFGAIATANALSDVYAMGGRPITAMAILAYPTAVFEPGLVQEILQGASDKIAQAKCAFVGGHSIDDDALKFGLSVTGLVHPQRVWSNATAKLGDKLILTKPLGTGTLCSGLKKGQYDETQIKLALESMARLNNVVDFLPPELLGAIHAATDVTGFGLSGHSFQMARASSLEARFEFSKIPRFENVMTSLKENLTRAHRTNAEYTSDYLQTSVGDLERKLLHDPQTSGGLLLSVAPDRASSIVDALHRHFPGVGIIGEFGPLKDKYVTVEG